MAGHFEDYSLSDQGQILQPVQNQKSVYIKQAAAAPLNAKAVEKKPISCHNPYIIDGDTFDCDGTRIRLSSIDAPEMPDHCRKGRRCTAGDPFASKKYLRSISRSAVMCHAIEMDSYGRTVARCESEGQDLSCAMVKAGHAVERYGSLTCS